MEHNVRVLVFRRALLSQAKLSHDPLRHVMLNNPHAYQRDSDIPKCPLSHARWVNSKLRIVANILSGPIWLPVHLHQFAFVSTLHDTALQVDNKHCENLDGRFTCSGVKLSNSLTYLRYAAIGSPVGTIASSYI